MYSISIFYFKFYLFGWGVRTHPTHPPPTGLRSEMMCQLQPLVSFFTAKTKVSIIYCYVKLNCEDSDLTQHLCL